MKTAMVVNNRCDDDKRFVTWGISCNTLWRNDPDCSAAATGSLPPTPPPHCCCCCCCWWWWWWWWRGWRLIRGFCYHDDKSVDCNMRALTHLELLHQHGFDHILSAFYVFA